MNLRSYHILTQTEKGRDAWRSQDMPGLSRKLLATVRAPMTVNEVLARLEVFDMTDVTKAIVNAATEGWVTVEEPPRAVPVDEAEVATLAPEDVLSDLVSRRPPPVEPVSEEPPAPVEPPVLEPVYRVVSEAAIPARGTEDQEHAVLVAMGIVSADRPLSPAYAEKLAHREARRSARHARDHEPSPLEHDDETSES